MSTLYVVFGVKEFRFFDRLNILFIKVHCTSQAALPVGSSALASAKQAGNIFVTLGGSIG